VTESTLSQPAGRTNAGLPRSVWLAGWIAAAMAVDILFQRATGERTPGLFLLPAVIAIAAAAGPAAGLLAAVAAVVFAGVDLSQDGPLWRGPYDRAVRLAVLCATTMGAGWGVGRLRQRVLQLTAERVRHEVQTERDRAAARAANDDRAFASERAVLQQQRDRLADADRQSQRRVIDLIAAVPGVVWEATVDADGTVRVTFVSQYVQHLLGYEADRWMAAPDGWLSAVHPDDRAAVVTEIRRRCDADPSTSDAANGVDPPPLEFRCVAQDGTIRWVETRVVEVTGETGRCTGLRGVTLDVTARHQLDAALRDRAAELSAVAGRLQESNDELDQFAYVASHDLKAPLRGIANLSNWIEEDLGSDRLTDEARRQFDLLRGRVQRMERLIDGLLQYSQVGRTQGTVEWVDVGQLVAEVIDWVAPPARLRVTVGPGMPSFNADRLRLGQVLANLVANAVKHHGAGDGWVAITCRPVPSTGEVPNAYEFAVSDDGPGIDPRYHERIFGVFQTLQSRDKLEGTGVGLALVRKVVAAKGGAVAVESAVGRGATFRFTWPRVDPAQPVPPVGRAALRLGPTPPPSARMQEAAS
jgi:signal transduction histidine kinase